MSQRIEMVGNPSEQEVRLLVGKINTYGKKADLYKDMGFHDKSIRMCKMLVSIKAEAFGPDSIMCLQEQAMLAAQYELHGYVKRAESTLKNLRAKLESIEWEHPPLTQHIEYLEKKIADGRRENNQPSPSQHDEQQQQNTWSSKMAWSPSEATDFLDKLLTEEQPKDDGGVNHVTVDMSGVELPERPPIAPGDISTLGIRLSFVNRLVVALGGVKALGDMTTTDMCMEFVKPMTEAKRASLCDVILEKGYDKVVRPARFFISHAWMYRFADVVEALDVFFDREGESNPEQIYIWFDLFTNSQHDTAAKPFDWWEHRFLDAIRSIQNVVMILTPWSNPIPLTRAWCVYEVFACRRTSSNFHITMPTRELISLNDGLKDDPTKFHDVLKSISCALCQATNPTDKDNIFKAVHRIMGFPELDRLVLQTLENWVVDRLDKCIDIPVDKGHSPGNIRRLLNNSIESEEGEEENPNMVEQLEDMAGYHFALGYWRVQQGRYRHAWDPIRANLNSMNVLEIYYKTKGGQRSFQQQIDRAAVLLGTLYERSGQFEKAREEAVSPILNEVLTNIGEEPTQRRRVVPFLALELGMCISEDRQEDVKQWLSVIQSLVPTLLSADGPKGEEIVMLYRQLCRIKANSADSELDRESLLLTLPKIVAKRFGDESEESKECGRLQEGYFIRFGQYSSAVQLIKEKLAAVTSSKGIDATETQIIVKRLYDLYVTMENFQLAESLVKEHVESLKTVLEADNIQLLWWKGELGKAMLAANKTAEAKEVFFQLMQEMQEKLGGASFLFSKTLDLNKLTKDDAVDRRTMRVLYYAGACAKSLGIIFPISEPQRIFFGDGDFDYLDTKILLNILIEQIHSDSAVKVLPRRLQPKNHSVLVPPWQNIRLLRDA
ncbi:hypothetical protein DFJ73DRAFT_822755 [Zopfochytrium polystomum]|nr:hypothetical protein DFJ73DRAFT_822755 [Zopfochytrium polystomum]